MFFSSPRSRSGFTLVEMLTAMAIFVIMIAFLGQLISNTSVVTNASKGRLNSDDQARFALDRIGNDFIQMSKRTDLDYIFDKTAGLNDEIYFYSEVPGIASGTTVQASGLSLVGYRVNSDDKLVRFSQSKTWDEVSFLTFAKDGDQVPDGSSELTRPAATDDKFHVLCDGVFRFEITFLLRDGLYSDKPILDAGSKLLTDVQFVGQRHFDLRASTCVALASDGKTQIWRGLGWKDVSAIIVTIAVLDDQSRKILTSGELSGVADKFANGPAFSPDPDAPPVLPLEKWTDVANHPNLLGIPKKAASAVRIYQRAFYLNTL